MVLDELNRYLMRSTVCAATHTRHQARSSSASTGQVTVTSIPSCSNRNSIRVRVRGSV